MCAQCQSFRRRCRVFSFRTEKTPQSSGLCGVGSEVSLFSQSEVDGDVQAAASVAVVHGRRRAGARSRCYAVRAMVALRASMVSVVFGARGRLGVVPVAMHDTWAVVVRGLMLRCSLSYGGKASQHGDEEVFFHDLILFVVLFIE